MKSLSLIFSTFLLCGLLFFLIGCNKNQSNLNKIISPQTLSLEDYSFPEDSFFVAPADIQGIATHYSEATFFDNEVAPEREIDNS